MSFLEVMTRTFVGRRPDFLLRCHLSLRQLESDDWTHHVLMDDRPMGVAHANRKLADHEARGEWVWVLDDDDVCCYPGLIDDVRWFARTACPDAVIVRARWAQRDLVLPPDDLWGERLVEGKVGTPCVITRRDIWNQYRVNWGCRYAGDFDYINGLFDAGLDIAWLDVVAAEVPAVNLGRSGKENGNG